MGWFAKVKTTDKSLMEIETAPDKNNPYSRGIEDEGELVTIVHTRNIEPLDEDEKEEEDDSTSN